MRPHEAWLRVGVFVLCFNLTATATAVVDPYTPSDRMARQQPWLASTRANFDPDFDYPAVNEFGVGPQLHAMAAELEWQVRGLDPPYADLGDIDTNLAEAFAQLQYLSDHDHWCGANPPPSPCTANSVVMWRAVLFSAYLLAKYPSVGGVEPWSQATKDAALALFEDDELNYQSFGLGNVTVLLPGARLLGGIALDDAGLRVRGATEFTWIFDWAIRRGPGELLSGHYTGHTIADLTLVVEGMGAPCSPCPSGDLDPVRERASNFLTLALLVVGHHYLPGGGVGAPQDRTSGGALTDKDPTDDEHLIQALNSIVYDPALLDPVQVAGEPVPVASEVGYLRRLVTISYQPPEIVRSVFLDKGSGYRFWRRASAGTERYPVGMHGAYWDYQDDQLVLGRMPTNPVQAIVLPNGDGSTGIRYGNGSPSSHSSGTYLRDPIGSEQASTADLGFALVNHRQPKNAAGPDPLVDDPVWTYERHTPYRRMMFNDTVITLFDYDAEFEEIPTPDFHYTQVHLPDFKGLPVDQVIQDSCNGWRVTGIRDRSWFAFYPLSGDAPLEMAMPGPHDPNPAKSGDEQGGDWTYLELSSSASSITGDITVLEPWAAHPQQNLAAGLTSFCSQLAQRSPSFDELTGSASVETSDPQTGATVTMKLTWEPEERTLQYKNQPAVVQADEDFLDRGLLHSEWIDDPGSSVHFDDSTFELSVERTGYEGQGLLLYFGPEGGITANLPPTAPGLVTPRWEKTGPNGTAVRVIGRPWDDSGVASYELWLGEPVTGQLVSNQLSPLGQVFVHQHNDPTLSRCALQEQPNPIEKVLYTLRALDDGGTPSVNHARVMVPEDAQAPTKPGALSADPNGQDVVLSWGASADECGILMYEILRDDGANGPLTLVGSTDQTTFTDPGACAAPGVTYQYEVRAVDTAPNTGLGVQEQAICP